MPIDDRTSISALRTRAETPQRPDYPGKRLTRAATLLLLACVAAAPIFLAFHTPKPSAPPAVRYSAPPQTRALPPDRAPADSTLPTVAPPNLASERKDAFIADVLPLIAEVNRTIAAERRFLERIAERSNRDRIDRAERDRLAALATTYETAQFEELLHRVDVIPPSLALAQAAIESAWGASRFATEGHALFGQRRYRTSAGMTPRGVDKPDFRVVAFRSRLESVAAYANNLNTHERYAGFRKQRAAMRARDAVIDGHALAATLVHYSERGEEYVTSLRRVIAGNGLHELDAPAAVLTSGDLPPIRKDGSTRISRVRSFR